MRCTRTVDAGAYVLGALAPTERAAYERHLAGCADCRNEVAELAVLPGLLGRLDAGTAVATLAAPPVQAPPGLLAATLRAATAERGRFRRRRHWQLAGTGLAAACLAVLLGVGGATMMGGPQAAGPTVMGQMSPVAGNVPIVALVAYSAAGGVTEIKMLCAYEDMSGTDTPWMVHGLIYPRGGGDPERTNVWKVGPGNPAARTFTVHTRLAPADIDRIELVNADGSTLLSYQPA
jgi:anti-sigma-K factor RskA